MTLCHGGAGSFISNFAIQFPGAAQLGQPPESRLQRESKNLEIPQFMSDFPKSNPGTLGVSFKRESLRFTSQ